MVENILTQIIDFYKNEFVISEFGLARKYLFLFVIYLVAFGYYGTVPMILAWGNKQFYINDYKNKLVALETKNLVLEDYSVKLKKLDTNIKLLDINLPSDSLLDNYLLTIVNVFAKHGFSVSTISVQDSLGDYGKTYSIRLTSSGNITDTAEFVKDVESLKRITTVKSLLLSAGDNGGSLTLLVEIYSTNL